MPTCPNLREICGSQYRIGHDEAATTPAERKDPWNMVLPCRFGIIYPHGPDRLALEIDYHGGMARRVATLAGVSVWQDGDGQMTFLFPLASFDAVAAIVLPKRRRLLSPEQRETNRARLARYQFASRASR